MRERGDYAQNSQSRINYPLESLSFLVNAAKYNRYSSKTDTNIMKFPRESHY